MTHIDSYEAVIYPHRKEVQKMADHRIYIQAIELALFLVSQGVTPDRMMATPEGVQLVDLIKMIGEENEQEFFRFYELYCN